MSEIILTDAPQEVITPWKPRNAQMHTKICFWHNPRTDHILQGGPEWMPVLIPGYVRIVCNHASEAEMWSKRLADQDKRQCELTQAERIEKEGRMLNDLLIEHQRKLNEATDPINRRILARCIQEIYKAQEALRVKEERESYLHVEAFEDGK